ncbi:hypothetical protein [Bdellovibrio bacteriovorus]|uniref:hypothetical protein n=1 Tax=Bdellovibrio bacteriovorus TaxID=959 RepID=UPI00045C0145|nr:hypothetical protein [Bdellovibrio bacteriovorus]AHZ84075.1 hypothetical protein EP01_03840 [Bdellovibrio bacteriovorus]BEV67958.1 hypothetical protein Bb109J_c1378 [Bdellovibrio bacteriovorus]
MKWLGFILPFILGFGGKGHRPRRSLKDSALEIYDAITIRSRKAVFLSMGGLGAIAFVCGGIFMFLTEATSQYDRAGFVMWNSTLITSLTLVALAVGGLSYVYFYAWPGVRAAGERREAAEADFKRQQEIQAGSLEAALSALVMDFVKEREMRRELRARSPSNSATSSESELHRARAEAERPSANLH